MAKQIMRIKVGESIYKIIEVKRVINPTKKKGFETQGQIHYEKFLIENLKNQNEYEKSDTIFHEITHAILFELNKKHKKEYNEEYVEDLSKILKTAFKIKKLKKNE